MGRYRAHLEQPRLQRGDMGRDGEVWGDIGRTSSSHGCSAASKRTSNPKSWKQLALGSPRLADGIEASSASEMVGSTAMSVLTSSSSTLAHAASAASSPTSAATRRLYAESDHLKPAFS